MGRWGARRPERCRHRGYERRGGLATPGVQWGPWLADEKRVNEDITHTLMPFSVLSFEIWMCRSNILAKMRHTFYFFFFKLEVLRLQASEEMKKGREAVAWIDRMKISLTENTRDQTKQILN